MEFYPNIRRRSNYRTKANGDYYANYNVYRHDIDEDCGYRCVYCDITIMEHGGEGFHLDHFRPQKLFAELANNPNNLVSSCPKCNLLKSDHWPVNYPAVSLLDPFEVNRSSRFNIENDGKISASDDGLAKYQIRLLSLNRPARIQLRRSRVLSSKIQNVIAFLDDEIQNIITMCQSDPQNERIIQRLRLCHDLIRELRALED